MKLHVRVICALSLGLLLAACWDDEGPNRTVQYYLDNPEERAEMMGKCEVMDDAMSRANCRNASAATLTAVREETRKREEEAVRRLYGDGS